MQPHTGETWWVTVPGFTNRQLALVLDINETDVLLMEMMGAFRDTFPVNQVQFLIRST